MGVKSVKVDLYNTVIKETLHDLAGKDVVRVTLKVMNRAKVLTPVDTGNLRASHQFRIKQTETKFTGEVFNKVKYALPVHEGRRPVVIRPKKKKALAFVWHGQPMVRKWVSQPARRGKPWLRDALREVATSEGYIMQSSAAADSGGDT
jgi:bacteriophage HK97-gp10 putative tail-component